MTAAGLDAYPTPPALAQHLVRAARARAVDIVVDPAAGDGALLAAAAERWPGARLVGADVDPSRRRRANRERPWSVQTRDLLDAADRAALGRSVAGSPRRCVLLNPPFSFRGGRYWEVEGAAGLLHVSRAMAFLLHAAELAGARGEVVAVVPAGLLHGARDAAARAQLERTGTLATLGRNPIRTFRGAVTATALVRWAPATASSRRGRGAAMHDARPADAADVASTASADRVTVVRGTRQMHTVNGHDRDGDARLVHTTALRENRLLQPLPCVTGRHTEPLLRGPAVLVPRVGRPDRRKLVLIDASERLVLSDCVFALCCETHAVAERLAHVLERDFDTTLAPAYGGTGAPYITLQRLIGVLRTLGWDAQTLDANATASRPVRTR